MPVLPDDSPTPTPGSGAVQPWATVEDVCAPCNEYGFDEALLEDCLEVASSVLYELTGRLWPGEITDAIRPCGMRSTQGWGHVQYGTFNLPLVGWCGCRDSRACGCSRLSEIQLPGFPVVGVDSVKIDGVEVDPARYRVDDHRWLVYLPDPDGIDPREGWPCCQRIDLADTELDTFSVTYTYGTLPDKGGVMAAASLGCQLALSCSPSSSDNQACRLPKRITSITRQGVSMAILDPLTLFKDGQTGLPEVDLWVSSKLVGRSRRRATVHRVGSSRTRRAGQ